MQRVKSQKLFNKTKKMIPGGVNSPVRSFSAVAGSPFIVKLNSMIVSFPKVEELTGCKTSRSSVHGQRGG